MKGFVIKVLIFLVPVLVASVVIEVLLRRMPNDYRNKSQALKHGENIEVLCLGSSHALYSVNPAYLDYKAYNGAFVAQSVDIDLKLLQHHIADLPNLKVLMLPVTYITLAMKLEDGPEVWRMKNYNLYHDHIFPSYSIDKNSELLGAPFHAIYYRLKDYYIFGKSPLTCTPLGFGTNYKFEDRKNLASTGKLTAERHTVKDKTDYRENKGSIESIISLCKAKNVRVVLFTTPANHAYRDYLDLRQLNAVIGFAQQMEKQNPGEVYYFNLFEDSDFVDADYYDGDHLNDRGAKKFSLKLNAYLARNFSDILSTKKDTAETRHTADSETK